jgi:hypothetical protein
MLDDDGFTGVPVREIDLDVNRGFGVPRAEIQPKIASVSMGPPNEQYKAACRYSAEPESTGLFQLAIPLLISNNFGGIPRRCKAYKMA